MHYRLGVGIVLKNKDNLIFAAERSDTPNAWQMPQGGIEKGETTIKAMWRELQEEVGSSHASLLQAHPLWLSYSFSKTGSQVQKWFLLEFLGKDSDIHLGAEFSRWKWVTPSFLLDTIVSFKKDVYKHVFEEFKI